MGPAPSTPDGVNTPPVPAAPPCPADYRGDHHRLLVQVEPDDQAAPEPAGATGPDAIVIPVARSLRTPLPGLDLGYRLATALDIPLVLQCSRDARSADLPRTLVADPRVTVVELDAGALVWRRSLRAHKHPLSGLHRVNDVGPKRSEALLQAARQGWRQVLFLDDDVWQVDGGDRTLDVASLRAASAALAGDRGLRVVGWTSDDFPDNSVYGHARRQLGEPQTVFIGSGALLVTVDEDTPFFPDIYNEDWLFMIESARRAPDPHLALGHAGSVNQLPYWPFKIKRARSEEAGDLLAEALMNLLEDRPDHLAGVGRDREYWKGALDARQRRLEQAREALAEAPAGPGAATRERKDANTALLAAEGVRAIVPAYSLAEYYADWQEDLALWRDLLGEAISSGRKALAMS